MHELKPREVEDLRYVDGYEEAEEKLFRDDNKQLGKPSVVFLGCESTKNKEPPGIINFEGQRYTCFSGHTELGKGREGRVIKYVPEGIETTDADAMISLLVRANRLAVLLAKESTGQLKPEEEIELNYYKEKGLEFARLENLAGNNDKSIVVKFNFPTTSNVDEVANQRYLAKQQDKSTLPHLSTCAVIDLPDWGEVLIGKLAPFGGLLEFLRTFKESYTFRDNAVNIISLIIESMYAGLKEAHDMNLVHADLAARNYLVKEVELSENKFQIKKIVTQLSDFGSAIILEGGEHLKKISNRKMPIRWMDRTYTKSFKISKLTDRYSFKITLLTLLSFILDGSYEHDDLWLKEPNENNQLFLQTLNELGSGFALKTMLNNVKLRLEKFSAENPNFSEKEKNYHLVISTAIRQIVDHFENYLTFHTDAVDVKGRELDPKEILLAIAWDEETFNTCLESLKKGCLFTKKEENFSVNPGEVTPFFRQFLVKTKRVFFARAG